MTPRTRSRARPRPVRLRTGRGRRPLDRQVPVLADQHRDRSRPRGPRRPEPRSLVPSGRSTEVVWTRCLFRSPRVAACRPRRQCVLCTRDPPRSRGHGRRHAPGGHRLAPARWRRLAPRKSRLPGREDRSGRTDCQQIAVDHASSERASRCDDIPRSSVMGAHVEHSSASRRRMGSSCDTARHLEGRVRS